MTITARILKTLKEDNSKNSLLNILEIKQILLAISTMTEEKALVDRLIYLLDIFTTQKKSINNLSKRQYQILTCIGLGFTTQDIAILFNLSKDTISTHRKNIIKKLELSGAGQLQNFAYNYVTSNN